MRWLQPYEPAATVATYDYSIPLGSQTFRLRLRWDERSAGWYLSISTAADVLLRDGIRLVVDFPLLLQLKHDDRPDGELFLFDTEDTGAECGADELGWRCKLAFVPSDEFPVSTVADYGVTIS
jgi:hypothetical protein